MLLIGLVLLSCLSKMGLSLIEGIIGLLGTIGKIYETAQSRKYLENIREAKEDIREEWSKGDKADMAKIETKYAEVKENLEAFNQELLLHSVKS